MNNTSNKQSQQTVPQGWKEVRLGDVIIVNDATYSENDNWNFINYLDTGSITENKIESFQSFVVNKEKIPSRAKRKVQQGDIVYSTVRPNQKHFGILKKIPKNFLVSTGFTTIRAKKNTTDTHFIYCYLTNPFVIEKLQIIGEHSVSAYPSIKPFDIQKLIINLPPLPEQKAIASILGTLDDKIELNRQINETLEAMAQALFTSWFVNFDPVIDNALKVGNPIPNKFKKRAERRQNSNHHNNPLPEHIQKLFPNEFEHHPTMGWIPKGWGVESLDSILSTIESGKRPKGGINKNLKVGFPSLGAESINGIGNFSFSSTKYITEEFYQSLKKGIVRDYDVLIYKDGAYIGKKAMFGLGYPFKEFSVNEHVFILRSNEKTNQVFLYFALNQNELAMLNANSAQPGLNQQSMRNFEILISTRSLLGQFEKNIKPHIKKILQNAKQNQTLTQLRDTLLPQLISGQVRIKDIEKYVDTID